MPRDDGSLTDREMSYDNSSRIGPKRSHQWFTDATGGAELFCNKKQAIDTVSSGPISGISGASVSPWHNASSFQSVSGQFTGLFGSEPIRSINLFDRDVPSVGVENINMGRKDLEHHYDNDSSAGLSMHQTISNATSELGFGGLRKVKVNQVGDSNSGISATMEHSFNRDDDSKVSMHNAYNRNNSSAMSLDPNYGSKGESMISIGPTFTKADGSFISTNHFFDKQDGSFIPMGQNLSKGSENILSMGQPFAKEVGNFISMSLPYEKSDNNLTSVSMPYDKGHNNFISMVSEYGKTTESFISMVSSYGKDGCNMTAAGLSCHNADCNAAPVDAAQSKGASHAIPVTQNYKKGDSNTISFGPFHHETVSNPSGSMISSYNLLMNNQISAQAAEVPGGKELVGANLAVNNVNRNSPVIDSNPKNKEPKIEKKAPPNSFPSNVKSLLSTGMLDGVAVKYVSWSREKSLKGIIKGAGYMCGCNECNFGKALNAYEFERHANCKTKHPNNHIYFENGKTIYAVVQELKNTPQEKLFDVIQGVTGSQINQKNFRTWKASYQAATRELQRIYGKDEVTLQS